MKRNMDFLEIALIIFMALLAVFAGASAAFSKELFYIEGAVAVAAAAFGIWRILSARRDSRKFL